MSTSTQAEYENQSKFFSTIIHNHTNHCGDTARATSPTEIIEKEQGGRSSPGKGALETASNKEAEDMNDFFEGLVQTLKDEIKYDKKEQGGRSSPENTVTYRSVQDCCGNERPGSGQEEEGAHG